MSTPRRLEFKFGWHCRRAGGLFLGVRVQFPVRETNLIRSWDSTWITFGFLFFSIGLHYNSKPVDAGFRIPIVHQREVK